MYKTISKKKTKCTKTTSALFDILSEISVCSVYAFILDRHILRKWLTYLHSEDFKDLFIFTTIPLFSKGIGYVLT